MELFAQNLNPLDIDHVLIRVLENLEIKDLRSCREVSSTWNKYVVKILQERGQVLTLENENIHQYLQLLTARPDESQELQLLDIQLKISVPPDSHSVLYAMVDNSLKIQHLIGRPCFTSLEYGHDGCDGNENSSEEDSDDTSRWNRRHRKAVQAMQDSFAAAVSGQNQQVGVGIWKLIQLISPTLQRIHFHGQLCHSPQSNLELATCLPNFSFPQLQSIHCDFVRMNMHEPIRHVLGPLSLAFLQIIHESPVLTNLSLIMDDRFSGQRSNSYPNFDTKYTINRILGRINQVSLDRITSFKIAVVNEETADTLIGFQFPRLSELEVLQSINCLARQGFCDFLSRHCPQLTALKLPISMWSRNFVEQIPREPLVVLPMPNITHFSCRLRWTNMAKFFDQIVYFNLTTAAQMFPSVESMETDLYALAALKVVSLRPRPIFPNVRRLVVMEDSWGDDNEDLKCALDSLIHEMCPNFRELEYECADDCFKFKDW